jgi:hypothetical protein
LFGCDETPQQGPTAAADCSAFTEDLRNRLGLEAQLVLNLSLGDADTYDAMVETTGLPDPETFRQVRQAFENLDLSGVEMNPFFQRPPEIVSGLTNTAELLQDALAAGTRRPDPAWDALSDFYTSDFFVTHNASINYYLGEVGCD